MGGGTEVPPRHQELEYGRQTVDADLPGFGPYPLDALPAEGAAQGEVIRIKRIPQAKRRFGIRGPVGNGPHRIAVGGVVAGHLQPPGAFQGRHRLVLQPAPAVAVKLSEHPHMRTGGGPQKHRIRILTKLEILLIILNERIGGEQLFLVQVVHVGQPVLPGRLGEGRRDFPVLHVHSPQGGFPEVPRGVNEGAHEIPVQPGSPVDHTREGNLVLDTVTVGISVPKSDEHVLELLGGTRHLQAELVQPGLINPHLLPVTAVKTVIHIRQGIDIPVRQPRVGLHQGILAEHPSGVHAVLGDHIVQRKENPQITVYLLFRLGEQPVDEQLGIIAARQKNIPLLIRIRPAHGHIHLEADIRLFFHIAHEIVVLIIIRRAPWRQKSTDGYRLLNNGKLTRGCHRLFYLPFLFGVAPREQPSGPKAEHNGRGRPSFPIPAH